MILVVYMIVKYENLDDVDRAGWFQKKGSDRSGIVTVGELALRPTNPIGMIGSAASKLINYLKMLNFSSPLPIQLKLQES